MQSWVIYAILALIMWGLWGFFPKLATNHISPKSVMIYGILGNVIIGLAILCIIGFKVDFHMKGTAFAILAGVVSAIGGILFLLAITKGKSSTVVTMTALYPLVTIALAFIVLKEPISFKQGLGMFFALTSMVLISV
jgi:bacterial/archaeal transporter family protein